MSSDNFNPFINLSNDTFIVNVCYGIGIVEFSILLPSILMILCCSEIVYKTSVLHRNLKCILLAQFSSILLLTMNRILSLAMQLFVYGNIFWHMPPIILVQQISSITFGNLVGHVLIVERMFATIYVEKYESYKEWYFTICWFLITVAISLAGGYHQIYVLDSWANISSPNFYLFVATLAASFIEIFVFSMVTHFNKKRFMSIGQKINNNSHQLTVRYQLTENIRTGRQLMPNFVYHFVSFLLTFVSLLNFRLGLISNLENLALVTQTTYLAHGVNNFMLLFAMIICHPLLNRKALFAFRKFKRIWCCHHSSVSPIEMAAVSLPIGTRRLDEKGGRNAETEAYFVQLQAAWK